MHNQPEQCIIQGNRIQHPSFIKLQKETGEILVRYQFSSSGTPEQPGPGVPRLSYIAKDQFSTDWNSELHTHSCAELFFILDGHGHFRTLYEEFPISVQDLLIVNANIPHTEVSSL